MAVIYRVFQGFNLEDFEEEVMNLLNQGWKEVGGVSILLTNTNKILYAQAIKKEETNEKKVDL